MGGPWGGVKKLGGGRNLGGTGLVQGVQSGGGGVVGYRVGGHKNLPVTKHKWTSLNRPELVLFVRD